jgi:AcrR family transcriptional regulator
MAWSEKTVAPKPRVGRPRKLRSLTVEDPREEILDAAAGLFEELGYAGTTTRKIAAAAGLQQGSIFHYFDKKSDILSALLDRTLEPATSLALKLCNLDAPADERLAVLAYLDVMTLGSGQHNLGALMYFPEVRAPEYSGFWEKRERLLDAYRSIVADGLDAGLFGGADQRVLTEFSCILVESVIRTFRRGEDDLPTTGRQIAEAVMRVVLAKPASASAVAARSLRRLRDPALRLNDSLTVP